MKKIFVIGKIGAGKSHVCRVLNQNLKDNGSKVLYIDLDDLGKDLLPDLQIQKSLKDTFGNFSSNKELANIVFKNSDNLNKINKIMHPEIFQKIRQDFETYKNEGFEYVVVEQSAFTGADDKFSTLADYILFVDCDKDIRLHRCMDKGMSEVDFSSRDALQCDEAAMRSACNLYVKNSFSIVDLEEKLNSLANKFL